MVSKAICYHRNIYESIVSRDPEAAKKRIVGNHIEESIIAMAVSKDLADVPVVEQNV